MFANSIVRAVAVCGSTLVAVAGCAQDTTPGSQPNLPAARAGHRVTPREIADHTFIAGGFVDRGQARSPAGNARDSRISLHFGSVLPGSRSMRLVVDDGCNSYRGLVSLLGRQRHAEDLIADEPFMSSEVACGGALGHRDVFVARLINESPAVRIHGASIVLADSTHSDAVRARTG